MSCHMACVTLVSCDVALFDVCVGAWIAADLDLDRKSTSTAEAPTHIKVDATFGCGGSLWGRAATSTSMMFV